MSAKRVRLGVAGVVVALLALVSALVVHRLSPGAGAYSDLRAAISRGDRRKVLALLDGGLDVKAPLYVSLLVTAIQYSDDGMVELLLERGALPNQNSMGGTPLGAAAALNRTTTIALLLAAGAQADLWGEGGVPLEQAVRSCATDAARLLVEKGATKLAPLPAAVRADACKRCPAIVPIATSDAACG